MPHTRIHAPLSGSLSVKSIRRCALIAIAATIHGTQSLAGINQWTQAGPPGGFTTAVVASPTQADRLIASTEGGIYYSIDGGASWLRSGGVDLFSNRFEFAPGSSTRVVGGNGFVIVSEDAGATFAKLPTAQQPPVLGVWQIHFSSDGGYLYASVHTGRLFRTSNMGTSWTEITGAWPTNTANELAVATDPNSPNTLYAGMANGGVYKSIDAGAHWSAPAAGPGSGIYTVMQIAVKPGDSNRVVVSANDGIWTSADGCASWTRAFNGDSSVAIFDPAHPQNAIAISGGGGMVRSADGGATFTFASAPLQAFFQPRELSYAGSKLWAASGDGPIVSTDNGVTFSAAASGILAATLKAMSASDDGAVYAVFARGPSGLFKRIGGSWVRVTLSSFFGAALPLIDVAVAPQNGQLVYVVGYGDRLVKSIDGGVSWAPVAASISGGSRDFQRVVVDPNDEQAVYLLTRNDGVWKSIDGGVVWNKRSNGLPANTSTLAIQRGNSSLAYVGTETTGGTSVFRTDDSGMSWVPTGPLTGGPPFSLTIAPDFGVYASMGSSLQWSGAAPNNWETVFGISSAVSAHFDRQRPGTYVVAGGGASSGFSRTVDSGEHWDRLTFSDFMTASLMDPVRPGLIYAGGTATGLQEFQVLTAMNVSIDAPFSPPVGSSFDTTVKVTNFGYGASASSVRITVPSFIQPTPPGGCAFAAPVLTCSVYAQNSATVPYSVVIPMVASAAASGAIVAQLVPYEPNSAGAVNQASANIRSGAKADVRVAIAAGDRNARVGGAVSLSLTVTNIGPDSAANSRVTITVPAAYGFTSVTSSAGPCSGVGTSTIICPLGELAKDATATILLGGSALLVTNGSTAIVDVRSDVTDDATANNVATAMFVIDAAPASSGGGGGQSPAKSGGGGSYDAFVLMLLGGLLVRRVRREQEKLQSRVS